MPSAIIYARYSPRPKDCDSIERQQADARTWCEGKGVDVRAVYGDPEVSGALPFYRRPGLSAALDDLRTGEYFVLRNLNRSARSLAVAIGIEEEIASKGGILVSVEHGGIQPPKDTDRYAWAFRMMQYVWFEIQRLEINERTTRAFRRRIDSDLVAGGVAPIGKQRDGDSLVDDDDESEVVGVIGSLHAQGMAPGKIRSELEDRGYSPRGERWHRNTVVRVIRRLERQGHFG